jgi:small-conductance mechanosensitive channel
VIFGLLLFAVHKAFRKADTALQGLISRRKISIHIQSLELVGAGKIVAFISGVLRTLHILLIILLLYAYVHSVMLFFPWSEPYASQILNFILRPLGTIGGAVLKAIPDLFLVAIIAVLAYYLLKLLQTLFTEIEKGSVTVKGFYPEWAQPTFKICRLLIIFIAAIMAFPYIPGSNSPAFKGISIFIGVLFSLGSTSAISNIMAGYSLIYRRVFKVGDRVKIADFMGDVIEMRLQVTHLRTIKNEEIVVPNSMIASSHVINYSSLASEKGLILHTSVTIGYDTPWRQVHALLLMAAEKTPGLLSDPAPFVLQTSLNDFYVSYELNAYTDTPHTMIQVYSDLHRNIQDAFNEYGVQIMSPSYISDPERPKVVPKDQWYASPAKPPEK